MDENTNGSTDTTSVSVIKEVPPVESYRPAASVTRVYDAISNATSRIVSEATYQAGLFVSLATHYDMDKSAEVRENHLVDASECLELAMTHLGQLRSVMDQRRRMDEIQSTADNPWQF